MIDLANPIFTDENKARKHLESIIWPDGPVCPHCGSHDSATKLKGKSTRPGVYKCRACEKPFSVTVGTVLERSKIPLRKWVMAFYLLNSSKKGVSAHQMHRMLGVTYKTAWFMMHRVREAMREIAPEGMGGQNKVVEVDETYVGGKAKNAKRGAPIPAKEPVITLVEREGKVRSFHLPAVSRNTLRPILVTQIDRKSYLMTDESRVYKSVGKEFAGHGSVNHSIDQYVRGGGFWHTNTVEGYFSILKRGITGIYQHVSQQHLKRYLGEFDFRYNFRHVTDMERTSKAIEGISGKRLTYRRTDASAVA
ncbi:MAG: IS1595 family transposase [Pseudomonadota bacterium]|nr:IS1595 family transposase [Pseudomonadota bacterium]